MTIYIDHESLRSRTLSTYSTLSAPGRRRSRQPNQPRQPFPFLMEGQQPRVLDAPQIRLSFCPCPCPSRSSSTNTNPLPISHPLSTTHIATHRPDYRPILHNSPFGNNTRRAEFRMRADDRVPVHSDEGFEDSGRADRRAGTDGALRGDGNGGRYSRQNHILFILALAAWGG